MSLTSIIGAASSALHQAVDATETAARSAVQPDVAGDEAARLQEYGIGAVAVSAAVVLAAVAMPAAAFTMGGGVALTAAGVGAAAAIAVGTAVAGGAALASAAASDSIDGAIAELGALANLVTDGSLRLSSPQHRNGGPTLPQPWADLVSFAVQR